MAKNITLAIEENLLDEVRVVAARNKTTVNAMVRGFLHEATGRPAGSQDGADDGVESAHQRMARIFEEGQRKYADRKWFDREEIHDREYQRAVTYFDNRNALLKLIDETTGDMGRQRWDRSSLYGP